MHKLHKNSTSSRVKIVAYCWNFKPIVIESALPAIEQLSCRKASHSQNTRSAPLQQSTVQHCIRRRTHYAFHSKIPNELECFVPINALSPHCKVSFVHLFEQKLISVTSLLIYHSPHNIIRSIQLVVSYTGYKMHCS